MSTYTDITCHLVFATKHRTHALDKARRDDLYRFIWGVLKERKSHLYRIGGVEDHIHILTSLHPSMALASLVKEVKTGSSKWVKTQDASLHNFAWQQGYGVFSVGMSQKEALLHYIDTQEEHHLTRTFQDEYRAFLTKYGIDYDERYVWD